MRSKELQNFLDKFTKDSFGKSQSECQKETICVFCHEKITGFRNKISEKEYKISGLCQKCQDEVFGVD